MAKLRQTFTGHAAETAAKQQPAATVTEATPAAVAPAAAASSLRADASEPQFYRPGPEIDDDILREGQDTQSLFIGDVSLIQWQSLEIEIGTLDGLASSDQQA